MSAPKCVTITLPKSLITAPCALNSSAASEYDSNSKFVASLLAAEKSNCTENRKTRMERSEDSGSRDGEECAKADVWLRGKKRRLDHLTWEEKLQRKKLKNRVAAQTSRDRKKAKLDELEDTVKALRESNELLTRECALLRARNENLIAESERLRCENESKKIGTRKEDEESYCTNCRRTRVGCAAPTPGSAVSPINPLPQGGAAQPASSLTPRSKNSIILKIMMLYLLSRNCSASSKETSTSKDSRNSRRAFYEKLPQKWKQALADRANGSRSSKIPLKNLTIQKEWWGRHQKMWKPVQPSKA